MIFEGNVPKGRFGMSAVNLGDIDQDKYEGGRIKLVAAEPCIIYYIIMYYCSCLYVFLNATVLPRLSGPRISGTSIIRICAVHHVITVCGHVRPHVVPDFSLEVL